MKINEAIEFGIMELSSVETPRNYTIRLLQKVLKKDKQYLIINDNVDLQEKDEKKFKEYIQKIKLGTPLQYITNSQSFMNIDFYVDENVLIPQPDTEVLVEEIIAISKKTKANNILDLCTGSGAIGISIAKYIKNAKVVMSDISTEALKIAKKNAILNKVDDKCSFIKSDLFENIDSKFDIIVSNPPYIETEEIEKLSKEVQSEPQLALDGGKDGLMFYRHIISNASMYLKDGGYIALEIGYNQSKEVQRLLENSKRFFNIYFRKDIQGIQRVIVAQKCENVLTSTNN